MSPFRRRCSWCGRALRRWQLNLCRTCKAHIEDPNATAPCSQAACWDMPPDSLPWGPQ